MSMKNSIAENSVILAVRKVMVAGIVSFIFLGLLMGIFGFIVAGIMRFLPFLNWQMLIAFILTLGILVNIFGSQKYSDKNSFGVIVARSVRKFAENIIEKNKDAFRANSVSFADLFGISHLLNETRETNLVIMKALLELTENKEIEEQLRKRIQETTSEEEGRDYSGAIYVLSANDGDGEKKDVLASSSPTPATGFILKVLRKWLHEENFFEVVHKITSGSLFANQDKKGK